MLRNGDIGGQKFSKIVGVGHSYGSVQMQALSATLPNVLDGVILQGFSSTFSSFPCYSVYRSFQITVNGTANPLLLTGGAYSIATEVFPDRFSTDELTNGYLVTLAVSVY